MCTVGICCELHQVLACAVLNCAQRLENFIKLAFHDADTDTDSPDTRLYILTSDTRDLLARILERKSMSVSVSVSVPWNASFIAHNGVDFLPSLYSSSLSSLGLPVHVAVKNCTSIYL